RHTRSDRDWSSDVCSSDLPRHLGLFISALRPCPRSCGASSGFRILAVQEDSCLVIAIRSWANPMYEGDAGQFASKLVRIRLQRRSEERRVGKECRSRVAKG